MPDYMSSAGLPVLETRRLILRAPTLLDARAMAKFAVENREHFAPWDPLRSDEYFSVANWTEVIREGMNRVADGSGFQFVLLPKAAAAGQVIGQCTFSGVSRGPFQAAYLGYGVDYREVGKGLMHEALVAAIRYCFEGLNLHRIMANHMPTNVRSARLLRRLGFVPEGYARDYLFIAGQWQDHVLTSLTNTQWKAD